MSNRVGFIRINCVWEEASGLDEWCCGSELVRPIHVIGMHALESNFESKFEFKCYEVLNTYVDLYEDPEVIPHSGTSTTQM
jgi:hypothetical protein